MLLPLYFRADDDLLCSLYEFQRLLSTRYIREKYPDVRVFHEDRPDIPEGVEVWHSGP